MDGLAWRERAKPPLESPLTQARLPGPSGHQIRTPQFLDKCLSRPQKARHFETCIDVSIGMFAACIDVSMRACAPAWATWRGFGGRKHKPKQGFRRCHRFAVWRARCDMVRRGECERGDTGKVDWRRVSRLASAQGNLNDQQPTTINSRLSPRDDLDPGGVAHYIARLCPALDGPRCGQAQNDSRRKSLATGAGR